MYLSRKSVGVPGWSKRFEKSKLPILARNLAVEGTAAIGPRIGRTVVVPKGGQFIMNLHCRKWLCLISVLAIAGVMIVAANCAYGQSAGFANINGRVIDPKGATVPDAKVTATNDDTGISRTTTAFGGRGGVANDWKGLASAATVMRTDYTGLSSQLIGPEMFNSRGVIHN